MLDQTRSEWNLGYPVAARATLQRLTAWKTESPDLAELQAQIAGTSLGEAYLAAHSATSPDTR